MNIVQLTPGAGGMYCGNCLRDNALVAEMRKAGHEVLLLPLYLPLRLDEPDQSVGTPIFFGGISVYLDQQFPSFRRAPQWLRKLLASPRLLSWVGTRAAKTRPEQVGDLTLSMLRGEEGNQLQELEDLMRWLHTQARPDVICLSNVLLVGLARRLKQAFQCPVVIQLSGEDSFLDALPETHSARAWALVQERAREIDRFIAPSRYYRDLMGARLGVETSRISVMPTGIHLDGYVPAGHAPQPPVIGYFARMCREKGLDTLVEAYLILRRRGRIPQVRLHVGGSCGPADEPLVKELMIELSRAGYADDVAFYPNLSRAEKQQFLRSLSVFSVPARYHEAFGLYLVEALAAGVPVVQPRHAAFPEIVDVTHGGRICEPDSAEALAQAIEELLLSPDQAHAQGLAAREVVFRLYSAQKMAEAALDLYQILRERRRTEASS